jgi:arginase family enzyme
MKSSVIAMNFSGVYAAVPPGLGAPAEIIDFSDITGTNRYCDSEAQEEIRKRIAGFGAEGIHFLDSGNYHYASKFWTDKITEPFALFVFDHHTDMQPPRFPGVLSCGSWVKEVIDGNVRLRGTAIAGVSPLRIFEAGEEYKTKVHFFSDEEILSENSRRDCAQLFKGVPAYISIDKDALRKEDAATDWDQGPLSLAELEDALAKISAEHRIIGIDMCGETSYTDDACGTALNARTNRELLKFFREKCPEFFR